LPGRLAHRESWRRPL